MTMRIYRWDDASAPTLNGGAGSLTNLLKTVLVGTAGVAYGAKTAAGWTAAWTGTNEVGLTNAGSGKGIRVSHAAAGQVATFYGYESIDGSGVATNLFPTAAQVSTGLYIYITSDTTPFTTNNRPWLIAADEKRFYLWIGNSQTTAAGLVSTAAQTMIFAGDILPYRGDDNYHFVVIGNTTSASSGGALGGLATNITSVTLGGHYAARSYTQTGTSVAVSKIADGSVMASMGQSGGGGVAYPDPVGGSMLLSAIRINEVSAIRGTLPGLWAPLHPLPGNPGDTFSGSGDTAGKTFILLDIGYGATRCRAVLETSNTWG